MNFFLNRLQRARDQHELYAWKFANRFGLLSIFAIGSTFVWGLLFLPVIVPVSLLMMSDNAWIAVPSNLIAGGVSITFLVWVSPWFFQSYFGCCALMFKGNSAFVDQRITLLTARTTKASE